MYNSSDFSVILFAGYNQYILDLGEKKIPTPYRRNDYGSYQKVAPEFQGKSSAKTILETTITLAKENNFDLNRASIPQIRDFMVLNKIGIDCSGFIYRMLDYLVQNLGMGNLSKAAGVEHVGRTNIAKLTSDKFSIPIKKLEEATAGDIIRLNSGEDVLHGIVVLENSAGVITYAHSSRITKPDGVHSGKIINGQLPEDLKVFSFNPTLGDGVKRLKILS